MSGMPATTSRRRQWRPGPPVWLLVLGMVLVAPVVWTFLAALGITGDAGRRPAVLNIAPTLDHVAEVGVEAPAFWSQLATSAVVAASASVVAVAIAFLAAYAITRSRAGGHRSIRQSVLILATVPVMAFVLPLGELLRRTGLGDSIPGLALAQAAITAPLALFVLASALLALPRDWEDAAMLDGAGLSTILGRIVVPLSAGAVASTLVILFVINWNQLLIPLVVAGVSVKTVPVAMVDFFTFERELDWPTAAAALIASLVPLLIVVVVFHRSLERFRLWEPARE
jgi:ABC-type glycerol-3-phosphate transport system permease component